MGDSQKKQRPDAFRINNPLLSASVTGLTFDDFPNKPLLLPAAPPIVHANVSSPPVTSGLAGREPKSLVIVGTSSLDTENLDEINLNASNDDNHTTDISDPNENPLIEQTSEDINKDSILSQAASSFSALPSVASNVLSTFSKRITAISSRETTPVYDQYQQDTNSNTVVSQLDIQPAYVQQVQQGDLSQTPSVNPLTRPFKETCQKEIQKSLSSSEPPKFYTPGDVPPIPSTTAPPSTNLSGQNNFRFSSKKKLYAPIPGLIDQSQKLDTVLHSSNISVPISYDTSYISHSDSQTPYSISEAQQSEERKLGSGLFSKISNFAPTGVLQNITGLVQSAAGSLTQTNKTDLHQDLPAPLFDQRNNYLEAPQPPTNYFVPQQQKTPEISSPILQPTYEPFVSGQPSGISHLSSPPPINAGISENYFQSESQHKPIFNTSNIPTQVKPSSNVKSPLHSSHDNRPPIDLKSSKKPPVDQSASTYFKIDQVQLTESDLYQATQVAFFDPAKYLPPVSQAVATSLPPTGILKVPPKSSGQTSFRLQKGTKLYKNPLTPQETASIQVKPYQIQHHFASQQREDLLAGSPASASGQSSVSLFAPPCFAAESLSNKSGQGVPLFVPAAHSPKSNESSQTIPLFALSNNPVRSLNEPQEPIVELEEKVSVSFAPPIKKHKSDETDQYETIEPIFEPNISAIQQETNVDPLEEVLQKLTLTVVPSESKTVKIPPIAESFNLKNPYRRGSNKETAKSAQTLPTLANFFTPEPLIDSANSNFFADLSSTQSSGNEVNFFAPALQNREVNKDNSEPSKCTQAVTTNFFTKPFTSELTPLEPTTFVDPPISAFFPTNSVPAILEGKNGLDDHLNETFTQKNLPPTKGFENFKLSQPITSTIPDSTAELHSNINNQQQTIIQTQQPEVVNRFSNYFNQTNQQPKIAKDHSTFFDLFPVQKQQNLQPEVSVTTNEEQRIQFFFNNPPPKDASDVGDLNYDLVHSGLGIKNLQQRSLTPISNLVEPPSSACSEFSEISNTTTGQKSIIANLSIPESIDKSIEKIESNKSLIEESESGILENNTKHNEELTEEIPKELRMANLLSLDKTTTLSAASVSYKPAVRHWFFKRTINEKQIWFPFSHYDSALLETSLLMEGEEKTNIVAVEGGRYDVNISERKKTSVYWESQPIEVRRCSWFYKAVDSKYVPYEEQTADLLENEYKQAVESGVWHKTIVLGMGEQVVFHGPTVIVHFQQHQNADAWGGTTQTGTRPRVVKRDLDDFHIEQGESQKVDHLLFMVHGIGSACDLKLRSVEEVVEDFRTIARQLVQSHYKNSTDLGLVGRVEVLPISWHGHLHSAEMGIDEKLRMITLESIPKLRNFTNDTLLDILFYTSPTFCQKIMNTIVSSMNTLYLKYRERHPEFNGGVSLAGHSLGSLILFDLLCHQNPIKESEEKSRDNPDKFLTETQAMDSNQLEDKQISYTMGPAGTGQPFINYSQLIFQPKKFFAFGSPIGMFVTIRGIDKLGLDFRLPTCPGFYNIFHPYDPVAYRIEALVNPDLSGIRPVLISHHKGRKRMHLELKETMARVSMDLKNRFLDKFKTTLDSVNIFGSTPKSTKEAEEMMEKEVDKVIQMQMQLEQQSDNKSFNDNLPSGSDCQNESIIAPRPRTDSVSTAMSDDVIEIDFPLGKLNDSKRIDYVLQEAPLEFINEYIFALSSHVCYWDSEDTILFVMKEIYSGLGISPDSQVPQQTMTIERPSSRNSLLSS